MDQRQIISQTVNDIDDFVTRLSDKINHETLGIIQEYKNQIKLNIDLDNNIAEDFCAKAIWFMQNYEIEILEKEQENDEKKMLSDIMFQATNISTNSSIVDGKISKNQTSFIKNLYYKYFYKWSFWESEFDDIRFILDILDNVYQLFLLSSFVTIICIIFMNYNKLIIANYYNIYTIWWFGFAIWLCKIIKAKSNISIMFDLLIIWCFAFWFWFSKLFFALS